MSSTFILTPLPYRCILLTRSSRSDAAGAPSSKQATTDVSYDVLSTGDYSVAPDLSNASGEARFREGSSASFGGKVSTDSSSSSDPRNWTPLERFCKEHERHERIALMMLSFSNCRGIYRNFANLDHIHYDITTPAAPTSTDAASDMIDLGHQEHLDVDHPLERYLDQIEDHELLAIAITHPENPPAETEYPSGLIPDTERDVSPTSMDAPSSISLHPGVPATHSTIPMKRSADAIEAQERTTSELEAMTNELLKEIRHTL